MCAVNGFNFKDETLVRKMNEATKHRGPDGTGVFADERVSLGHNLLAITEAPERSGQPAVIPGKLVLSYNGEIYNYRELRRELEREGERFKTDSDTEVLVKGLARHGEAYLKRLDGMFACAWYDLVRQKLFLARDSAGIKPLYVSHQGTKFIFSSELKGVFAAGADRVLDMDALRTFFLVGYVPGPKTLIRDIEKVCPGQVLAYDLSSGTLEKRWFASRETARIPFDPETLRNKIGASVSAHTMGLRPFGLYLSGGLDSTVILHELALREKGRVRTYTTRFETTRPDFNEDADRAKKLCEAYAVEHHELLVTEKDFIDAAERAIETIEEPRYNHSIAAYWLLAQHAAKDIVVVLNGSGGDELFLGYTRYLSSRILTDRYRAYPHMLLDAAYTLKAVRKGIIAPFHMLRLGRPLERWAYLNTLGAPSRGTMFRFWDNFDMTRMVQYLRSVGYPALSEPLADTENAVAEYDRLFWLADEEFIRTDKIAMHFGMEGRFPFLARDIIAYANGIPAAEKLKANELKSLVRSAYRGRLPGYIVDKRKTGWTAPVTEWMHSRFGEAVRAALSRDFYPPTAELFDFDFIRKRYLDGIAEFTLADMKNFLPVFSFQLWAKRFNVRVE